MSIRERINRRASARHLHGHVHVSGQRRLALWLTIFSAGRTIGWVLAMLLIGVHYLVVSFHWQEPSWLGWFVALSSTVLFVTLISFYCNASTDLANFCASIAALFSADAHHDAESTRYSLTGDVGVIEEDIARLADLQPGPAATELAADIRRRLAGAGAAP